MTTTTTTHRLISWYLLACTILLVFGRHNAVVAGVEHRRWSLKKNSSPPSMTSSHQRRFGDNRKATRQPNSDSGDAVSTNNDDHHARMSKNQQRQTWLSNIVVVDDGCHNDHDNPLLSKKSYHFDVMITNRLRGGDGTGTSSVPTITSPATATTTTTSTAPAASIANALQLLNVLDLFGTGVFAFSGSVTAGKRGMDLLGMMIISCITSIGGGTVRDLLLDVGPVFWIHQTIYLKICIITCLITYCVWPTLESKFHWNDSATIVCVADAIGLGAFAILGTQKGVDMNLGELICVLCGLGTATFGGVTRDVLCQQSPRIMYPHRTMYAGPAILGSIVYILLLKFIKSSSTFILTPSMAAYISFLVTFASRLLSFNNPRRLPHWNVKTDDNKK